MIYKAPKLAKLRNIYPHDKISIDLIVNQIAKSDSILADQIRGYKGSISDGYHSFDELYHHRALLFATICNMVPECAWKSKQHDDPNFPMYDGMFICGIETPYGQATYHYDIDPYWDLFLCKEVERAPKYDGHTSEDAINRIYSFIANKAITQKEI